MSGSSDSIASRIEDVLARREAAASRAGRHPLEIRMLAVTKGIPPAQVVQGARAGLVAFGENYVKEGLEKISQVTESLGAKADGVSWHFIGKLQRNKARLAVPAFELIHSVDTVPLAKEIDQRAAARGITQQILLEVNIVGEASKAGFTPDAVVAAARAIDKMKHVRLSGLMTVPPLSDDPEDSRPHFRALRELRDEIRRKGLANDSFRDLSMGMTGDFEVAIEEGATWIRVGTAIFGPRPVKK
ncbi:MAG: YggS family pyridoxal phosphate-dependent enzyme [Deltaproteobacteria bacterium]|nr:YggS family pyridoxal phosphate-dependent enzyme [Deltaproteobacteria bacterium]